MELNRFSANQAGANDPSGQSAPEGSNPVSNTFDSCYEARGRVLNSEVTSHEAKGDIAHALITPYEGSGKLSVSALHQHEGVIGGIMQSFLHRWESLISVVSIE